MTYSSQVSVNAAAIVPSWKEPMDELNRIMRSFGFHEQVQARSEIFLFTIQAESYLTPEQREVIRAQAERIAREHQPEWDFKFGPLELVA